MFPLQKYSAQNALVWLKACVYKFVIGQMQMQVTCLDFEKYLLVFYRYETK